VGAASEAEGGCQCGGRGLARQRVGASVAGVVWLSFFCVACSVASFLVSIAANFLGNVPALPLAGEFAHESQASSRMSLRLALADQSSLFADQSVRCCLPAGAIIPFERDCTGACLGTQGIYAQISSREGGPLCLVPLTDVKDMEAVTEAQLHAAVLRGAILGLAPMPSSFDLQLECPATAAEQGKSRDPHRIPVDPSGSQIVPLPMNRGVREGASYPDGPAHQMGAGSKRHVFKLWVEPHA
jgi:hypothetical protein